MKANGNLGNVQAHQGGSGGMLKAGGYACLIHDVQDCTEEENPYIGLILNIFDPTTKSMRDTQDLADPDNYWKHTYRYYISNFDAPGIDWGRYKALVEAVEKTKQNNGFVYQDVDNGEQQLKGKWMGVVMRHYLYVPRRGKYAGKEREGVELSYVCTADDAIAGNFDSYYTELRDSRPDYLRNKPFNPEPNVVSPDVIETPAVAPTAPTVSQASVTPAVMQAPVAPVIADEDIPF